MYNILLDMEGINSTGKYELSGADFLAVSRGLNEISLYNQKLKNKPVNSTAGVARRLGFNYLRTTVGDVFQAVQENGVFVFSHEFLGRYNLYVPAILSQEDRRLIVFSDNLKLNVDRKLEDFHLHMTQGDYDDFISREVGEIQRRYHDNLHDYSDLYGGDKVVDLDDFRPVQKMRKEELLVLHGNFQAFVHGVHSAHEMYVNLVDI